MPRRVHSLVSVSPAEVFHELAIAEVSSPQFTDRYAQALGAGQLARLRKVPVAKWSADELSRVEAIARHNRGQYLAPVLALVSDWYRGVLDSLALGGIQVIKLPAFTAIAPGRSLSEFVGALDAGRDTPGDAFGQKYRALRPIFDPVRMRGRPILVAESEDSPYLEVEGLTRLSCLLSVKQSGAKNPETVPEVLGVGGRLREWYFA